MTENSEKSKKRIPFLRRPAEAVLLIGACAAGLALFVGVRLIPAQGSTVVVESQGEIVEVCPLDVDADFTVEGKDGGRNRVIIENGSVRMEEASCPDLLCVRTGAIRRAGQSIICLPNQVVVEVRSEREEAEVDAIAQ